MWRFLVAWMQAAMVGHFASRPEVDPAPEPPEEVRCKFAAGEPVYKPRGYTFPGKVIVAFVHDNQPKYVVESDMSRGLLHIFHKVQLERRIIYNINNGGNH